MFRLALDDPTAFISGWSEPQTGDGLTYRWMQAEHAELHVQAEGPWRVLGVHCRFVDAVHHDLSVVATQAGEPVATVTLRWLGRGMHHQQVVLDRVVPTGPCSVHLDAVQVWREPANGRALSVAFAQIRGRSHSGLARRLIRG